jgi:hypothetical protein
MHFADLRLFPFCIHLHAAAGPCAFIWNEAKVVTVRKHDDGTVWWHPSFDLCWMHALQTGIPRKESFLSL